MWWAAAAGITVLLGSISWWASKKPQPRSIAAAQQLHNTSNKVRLVTLPEGSRVWLAPGSLLTVPGDFNAGVRSLELRGEAYFEVTAAMQHPFLVKTGHVQTTVLGTHFNIEAYTEEPDIKVSLTAGKVAVKYVTANGNDSTLLLSPGTRMVYKTASQQGNIEPIQPATEAAWQRGGLVLNNVLLSDAFRRLEKRFEKKLSICHHNRKKNISPLPMKMCHWK